MRTPRITRAARARRRPRDAMAFLLALATVVLARLPRARAAWNLQELWDDEVMEYVQQYTGDLDAAGTPVDSKFLKWEQTGWYQLMKDRSSAGMDKVRARSDLSRHVVFISVPSSALIGDPPRRVSPLRPSSIPLAR